MNLVLKDIPALFFLLYFQNYKETKMLGFFCVLTNEIKNA